MTIPVDERETPESNEIEDQDEIEEGEEEGMLDGAGASGML